MSLISLFCPANFVAVKTKMASDRRIVDVKSYKMNDLKTLPNLENHTETCSYLKISYSLFVFVNSSVLNPLC